MLRKKPKKLPNSKCREGGLRRRGPDSQRAGAGRMLAGPAPERGGGGWSPRNRFSAEPREGAARLLARPARRRRRTAPPPRLVSPGGNAGAMTETRREGRDRAREPGPERGEACGQRAGAVGPEPPPSRAALCAPSRVPSAAPRGAWPGPGGAGRELPEEAAARSCPLGLGGARAARSAAARWSRRGPAAGEAAAAGTRGTPPWTTRRSPRSWTSGWSS